jgi:signal transduction histidine kinase
MFDSHSPDPRLLSALASLNEIGTAINAIQSQDATQIADTLRLIVESAIRVVPGTSAVIYTYEAETDVFNPASRVSAGETMPPIEGDEPRPNGMGRHALLMRRRTLSYEEGAPYIHPIKVDAGAQAVVCFPLIVSGEAVGALYVYLHESRTYSELELLLLENFVNQAATAIYHTRQVARIQLDLDRREDENLRLRHASMLISSRPHLQDTLDAILQMALEVTGARYGNFLLLNKTGTELVSHAVAGERLSRPYVENIPVNSTGVTAWVARTRQVACIPDLREEPWASMYLIFDHDLEMLSELAVPLINASGRLEGVLNLESPLPGTFNERDNHLLQALAMQAVIAIQEVRLVDALKEVSKHLLTLPPEQVLQKLADLATDLLNAAAAAVWTVEGETLVAQAVTGDFAGSERIPIGMTLIGQAVLNREVVSSTNVRNDPRFRRPDLAQVYGWKRALIAPIAAGSDDPPIGALSVLGIEASPGRVSESDWDTKVLMILADYAALAILNAERQTALEQAREQHTVAETFAAMGDIAANLLHLLNNRVGSIPVRIEGIQDKCGAALEGDPYLASNLAAIEASAREAMSVVRDNLSLLNPIRLSPVDLAECVREAVQSAQVPPEIHIITEGIDGIPLITAGRQSLVLVFTNLLENAASAMGGVGTVTICGKIPDDSWIELEVRDTGPGISTQLQERIFEFYFSGHSSTHAGKLGFGLWWIKTLITRLGGTVAVESDGQHGTTFRLRLPLHHETL